MPRSKCKKPTNKIWRKKRNGRKLKFQLFVKTEKVINNLLKERT